MRLGWAMMASGFVVSLAGAQVDRDWLDVALEESRRLGAPWSQPPAPEDQSTEEPANEPSAAQGSANAPPPSEPAATERPGPQRPEAESVPTEPLALLASDLLLIDPWTGAPESARAPADDEASASPESARSDPADSALEITSVDSLPYPWAPAPRVLTPEVPTTGGSEPLVDTPSEDPWTSPPALLVDPWGTPPHARPN